MAFMNSRKNIFNLHLTLMPHQADEEKKEEVGKWVCQTLSSIWKSRQHLR